MTRYVVCVLVLVLVAAVACSFSTSSAIAPTQPPRASPTPKAIVSPTQGPAAPSTLPTPDWSRFTPNGLTPGTAGDPKLADEAEQALTALGRDESGIRTALGSQADEIFREVDQAEALAVQDIIHRLQARSKPKGMPAPLPPRVRQPGGPAQLATLFTLYGLLVVAPSIEYAHDPQGDPANAISPVIESDQTSGKNSRTHMKFEPVFNGSKMEINVEMTDRVEKDGIVYEQHVSARLSINECPNEQGNVPFDLTLQSSAAAGGSGFQLLLTVHAIGHVDDEGNLSSIDEEIQMEMAVQPGQQAKAGQEANQYVQFNAQFNMGGFHGKDSTFTGYKADVPRVSSQATSEFVEKVLHLSLQAGIPAAGLALDDAEKKWQDGYCVAVTVADRAADKVMPSSITPFTANVQHKFEGKALTVPVIATLASGQVSVSPAGVKVPAPATFRYKAPDKSGETATVELVSRSRRGIGKLTVTFKTVEAGYRVDGIFWGIVHLVGTICAADQPFSLSADFSAGISKHVGKFAFAPAGAGGGNWKYAGTNCIPEGCVSITGSDTYQLAGLANGKPEIQMNPFTNWLVSAPPAGSFAAGHYIDMVEPIKLEPAAGECPAK